MFVDVLGEDIGDTFMLLPPFEDGTIKVVFVEVAGEDIDGLILLQERWYDTIQVLPVVENQDRLLCFQHETTMEDVGQGHCVFIQVILIWGIPSNMILGAAFPASTKTFLPLR